MIGAFGLLLVLQGPVPQSAALETDPGAIVSKMLAKYARASSLEGTIVQETSDTGGTLRMTTKVSYVRPNFVYVEQDRKGRNGVNLLLVSDSTKFKYPPPNTTPVRPKPGQFLYEPRTVERVGFAPLILTVGDMYHAAHTSLAPVTLLDLCIAHTEHLKDFKINVATLALAGTVSYKGKGVYRLTGQWRPYIGQDTATGYFELLVSQEFEALRFIMTETYNVNGKQVKLTVTETADLKIDVPVDPSVFKVG
jgi:outer membrane lipoprotein-sorting protein